MQEALTSQQEKVYNHFIANGYSESKTAKHFNMSVKGLYGNLYRCARKGYPLAKGSDSKVTSFMLNKKGEKVVEWHKTTEDLSGIDLAKEFKQAISTHKPYKYKPVYNYSTSGNAVEVAIHDLHFGSLCWGAETGENYDIKIAKKVFLDAINHFISATKHLKPELFILPTGSDFFNVNSKLNTTVAGTLQDEDCRYQKTFNFGLEMLVIAIDILRGIAPVHVPFIPGNHDEERAFYLGVALASWYRKCNNVTVDNAPTTRKYWQWGKCLLGLTHGSEEVKGTLPMIMATEQPQLWAKTKYREWHTGHLHHKANKSYDYGLENNGVRERIIGSLAAADSWHTKKGYSGLREAEAFIWNKNKGQIASFSYHPA